MRNLSRLGLHHEFVHLLSPSKNGSLYAQMIKIILIFITRKMPSDVSKIRRKIIKKNGHLFIRHKRHHFGSYLVRSIFLFLSKVSCLTWNKHGVWKFNYRGTYNVLFIQCTKLRHKQNECAISTWLGVRHDTNDTMVLSIQTFESCCSCRLSIRFCASCRRWQSSKFCCKLEISSSFNWNRAYICIYIHK